MESLKSRLERQKEALLEKDRLYEEIQLRLSSESESGALLKSECNTLRKQVSWIYLLFSSGNLNKYANYESQDNAMARSCQL